MTNEACFGHYTSPIHHLARDKMNDITRRIRERGINLKKWCDIKSLNYRYTVLVMNGKRGAWDVGVAQKIKNFLISMICGQKKLR